MLLLLNQITYMPFCLGCGAFWPSHFILRICRLLSWFFQRQMQISLQKQTQADVTCLPWENCTRENKFGHSMLRSSTQSDQLRIPTVDVNKSRCVVRSWTAASINNPWPCTTLFALMLVRGHLYRTCWYNTMGRFTANRISRDIPHRGRKIIVGGGTGECFR